MRRIGFVFLVLMLRLIRERERRERKRERGERERKREKERERELWREKREDPFLFKKNKVRFSNFFKFYLLLE